MTPPTEPSKDPSGLDEWRESRKKWDPVDSKLTLEWGTRQAESLWNNLYARWDPVIDGRTVLDLGCNWGYLLKYLIERYQPVRLIGIDIAPLWEQVRGWDWRSRSDIIDLYEGDLLSVDIEEESVDLILCSSVTQYLTPEILDNTLARAYRSLKPGGELMLRTQVYTSYLGGNLHRDYDLPYVHMLFGQRALEKRLQAAGRRRPPYYSWLTASNYLSAFARAGFEILDASRRINRHAPGVQERIAEVFPVNSQELNASDLEARLLRPVGTDELGRFGTVRDQRSERRAGLSSWASATSAGAADREVDAV